ncbi:MAG: helix-turn-helix domain-containing protein [Candidatus Omnitrophota bacterium]
MPETSLAILGEKLTFLRRERHLTMKRFQVKAGISQSAAYRLSSSGSHAVTEEILSKIGGVFGMTWKEALDVLSDGKARLPKTAGPSEPSEGGEAAREEKK